MTPVEYLKIEKAERAIIEAAERRISNARIAAEKCPPPKKRRPAERRDIVKGAIIWHERDNEHGGDYWNIVATPTPDVMTFMRSLTKPGTLRG